MWETYKKGYKAYLQLEKSLADNSVEAYMRDIDKLTQFLQQGDQLKKPGDTAAEDLRQFIRWINKLGMTPRAFREKWLYRDKSGDWMNLKQPCQFLDLQTNKCKIYAVRPKDCAGFPHHTKKQMVDYMHVYKQNIAFCPATFRVVEILMEKIKTKIT